MKKLIALSLVLVLALNVLTGCASSKTEVAETTTATGTTATETTATTTATETKAADIQQSTFNYTPVKNTTGKNIRIAVLTTQTNAFWVDVCKGTEDITAFLA